MEENTNMVEEKAAETAEKKAEEQENNENMGNIKIAVDVVSTIAGIATTEINGVASMYGTIAGGIAEILGAKKNPGKGVKVEMKEDSVVVDLYVIVEYGIRIPEIAWEIQENVKENIETMTGLKVEKVNIHIEGVNFGNEKKKDEIAAVSTGNPDDDSAEITD